MRLILIVFFLSYFIADFQAQSLPGSKLGGISLNYAPQKFDLALTNGEGKSEQTSYLIQPFFLHFFQESQAIGLYGSIQDIEYTMLESTPAGTGETFISESLLSLGGIYRIGHTIGNSRLSFFGQATLGTDILKRRTQTVTEITEQPGWGITGALRPGVRYSFTDQFSVELMMGNFKVYSRHYFESVQGQRQRTESEFSLNATFDLPTVLLGFTFTFE